MWRVTHEFSKPWAQVVQTAWRLLAPDIRARYEAIMKKTGKTRGELCREALELERNRRVD